MNKGKTNDTLRDSRREREEGMEKMDRDFSLASPPAPLPAFAGDVVNGKG